MIQIKHTAKALLLALLGVAATMFASCSELSDLDGNRTGGDDVRVRMTASSDAKSTMRAADGLYTHATGFDGGEKVKIWMNYDASPDAKDTLKTAIYEVGAPTSGLSELTYSSGGELHYPGANSGEVTLYGVFPSTSTEYHIVKYDQSNSTEGDANYKASDLMYATQTASWTNLAAKEALQPDLPFNHQLVKLKVVIVKLPAVKKIEQVRLSNVKRAVTINNITTTGLSLGEVNSATTIDGSGDEILLTSGETESTVSEVYTYCCLFPAQSWGTDETPANFLTIKGQKTSNSQSYTTHYRLSRAQWTAGHEYTVTIRLSALALDSDIDITGWEDNTNDVTITPEVEGGGSLYIDPVGDQKYTGSAIEPAARVYNAEGTELTPTTHYELSYYNNINPGTAMILATGKGDYEGQVGIRTFTILSLSGSFGYANTSVEKTYGDAAFTNPVSKTGNGNVTYTSSNTDVATVDETGEVTIKGVGTTTINATVHDSYNYWYNDVDGYVEGKATKAYTLTVNKKPVTITAKAQEITYPTAISSTPADVTATGLVSGHTVSAITLTPSITNAGTGTITPSGATIKSGATDVTANYAITYNSTGTLTIHKKTVSDWSISPIEIYLRNGVTSSNITIDYGSGSSSDHGTVTYANSNPSAATVSSTGVVTKVADGATRITVSIADGTNYTYSGTQECQVAVGTAEAYTLANSLVGYRVGSNGSAYPPVGSMPDGVTLVGMVAYKNGSHGLVIARDDAAGTYTWAQANGYSSSSPTCSGHTWRLGSKAEYINMGINGSLTAINTNLELAGCTPIDELNNYWSSTYSYTSTNRNGTSIYYWSFFDGSWTDYYEGNTYHVRPMFSF